MLENCCEELIALRHRSISEVRNRKNTDTATTRDSRGIRRLAIESKDTALLDIKGGGGVTLDAQQLTLLHHAFLWRFVET